MPNPIDICKLLSSYKLNATTEMHLQDGIEAVLKRANIAYEREFVLGPKDRPDFKVGDFVIEVKIKGGMTDALRQVSRYLEHSTVAGVILVGTPAWVRQMPGTLHSKPIYALRVFPSLF